MTVRRIALLALMLLAVTPLAFASHGGVHITDTGYEPSAITIAPGGQVVFQYDNLALHGADFADPAITDCASGSATLLTDPCPVSFPNPGRFAYTDTEACPDPCAFHGVVNVDGAASVGFTATPNPQRRDQPVAFDGSASEPGGTIASYSWDFGDGTTSAEQDPSHQYAAAGEYQVTLTVTDDLGGKATSAPQTISIFEPDDDADGFLNKDDACITEPGPPEGGNGCPLPPPPAPAAPVAIDVDQTAVDTLSLEGLARDGLTAVLECTGPCSATATLLPVSGIRLAQAPTPLATATGALAQAGTLKLTLKLTAAAKRALARVKKSARLKLVSAVTDSAGRVKSRTTALTVKRVAAARKLPRVGISDQQSTTFEDPNFTVLRLRYARLVTPWDSIFTETGRLHAWMEAAYKAGIKPLIAFNHARGDLCPKRPCRAPSIARYTRAVRAFRKKYPWVTDYSAWNEANHSTQPTGKKPKLAAQYYNALRRVCKRCKVTAADVLDQNNMRRWLTEFRKHVRGKPRLWGLHNYRDTNRFRDKGTSLLLKLVPGEVWLTETGGIVRFQTSSGDLALPRSERRAKRAMEYVFRLGAKHHKRIKRAYIYQWRINFAGDRFDAGVVSPDGKPRPSYDVISLNASAARR